MSRCFITYRNAVRPGVLRSECSCGDVWEGPVKDIDAAVNAHLDADSWPAPTEHRWGPFLLRVSNAGFGWELFLGRRVRWNSTRATSRMWPRILTGADEVCNRAVTLIAWPLGSLDVWWEPKWRTERCAACLQED